MHSIAHHFQIHWLHVLVAAVIQWILGAIWFTLLFGKSLKAVATGEGGAKGGKFAMLVYFIANFVLCFALINVVTLASRTTFWEGVYVGAVCWVGFMAPPTVAHDVYQGKRFKLFAIDASYWLLAMAVAGGVLAAWH